MRKYLDKITVLRAYPYQVLILLLCAFIIGIAGANFLDFSWHSAWPSYVLIALLLALCALINLLLQNRVFVLSSWLLVAFIGGLAGFEYQHSKYFLYPLDEGKAQLHGSVINNPLNDYKSQEIIVRLDQNIVETQVLIKAPRYPKFFYGDQISVVGELQKPGMIEDFDYARYLRPKRISYVILNPQQVEKVGEDRGAKTQLVKNLYQIKNNFEASLNNYLAEPYASLAAGIITGAKRSMPDDLAQSFKASGLTHIVALSGFNVTIIIVAISAFLSGLISRKKIFIYGSVLVILFIIMTGASSSVVRAGIFSLLLLYGKTIGRRAQQTTLLLLAAAIMLLFNPFLLLDDVGFQLSFLAFSGIIYFSKPMHGVLERPKYRFLPGWVRSTLAETLAAQIMVFPLIAFAFGRVSLISPVSNVLVLWIIPLAMLLSFSLGLFGMISVVMGKFVSWLTWPVLAYIVGVSNISSSLPLASLEIGKRNHLLIIGFYFIILLWWFYQNRTKEWLKT